MNTKTDHCPGYVRWSLIHDLTGLCLGLVLLLSLLSPTGLQAASPIKETYVKAVLLFNFTRYTQWPDAVFADNNAPYRICVLGRGPFVDALYTAVEGETVRGREMAILVLDSLDSVPNCQVLFVNEPGDYSLPDIFAYAQDYPMLTVGDGENFILEGGMVAYFKQGNKVRFAINPQAVSKAHLKISANLLPLARIIRR